MKILVSILLLSFAFSQAKAVDQKEVDKIDHLAKVYPFEKKDKEMKEAHPGLWIMTNHERGKLRERRPEQPKYRNVKGHGSNGGYVYA